MVHDLAPGERKKLTRWIREENHDIKAWPELFHDGLNGLYDPNREKPISVWQNYNSKVFNRNQKFAEDSDFLYVHHRKQFLQLY